MNLQGHRYLLLFGLRLSAPLRKLAGPGAEAEGELPVGEVRVAGAEGLFKMIHFLLMMSTIRMIMVMMLVMILFQLRMGSCKMPLGGN